MAQVRPWLWWALGGAVLLLAGAGAARSRMVHFKPHSKALTDLLAAAVNVIGLPAWWATSPEMHELVGLESGGRVGIPNYTYPQRPDESRWPEVWAELRVGVKSAKSSATGLGQLILGNVKKYYPAGVNGIADPLNEAVGMLRYVKDRYGSPVAALSFHHAHNWY